ncbi:hypothetical protein [Enterococcus casseliflavus]|uniref:hypothetical protein n=1 Tax=Enterococcus casseliflavus TaxID=37734 RepID=UPI002543D78D|nr:hypothetical protein [Enterococcus casseliflavus]MDK4449670.1 hypothetical protein [Enterococcus casseliflavus]
MKKVMAFSWLFLLLVQPLKTTEAQQTISKVGITFQQPTTAHRKVPLQQVKIKPEKYVRVSSKQFPRTNEQPVFRLTVLGVVIIAGTLVNHRRKVK